jgi:hypothetical protein
MKVFRILAGLGVVLGVLSILSLPALTSAQSAPPPERYVARATVVDPDQGKMGTYRALAELAYEASIEQHDAEAAALARILEKVWDRGEGGLRQSSPDTWSKIDRSMDGFIKPIIAEGTTHSGGNAASALVTQAYQQYLHELDAAD